MFHFFSLESLKKPKEKAIEVKRDIFQKKEEKNNLREVEREKERQKAEEVEKSILKKREEKNRNGPSTQPPRAFFTDFVSNKIVEPRPEIEIGTKERRKKFEAPQPPLPPPVVTKVVEDKKKEKDRPRVVEEKRAEKDRPKAVEEKRTDKDKLKAVEDKKTEKDKPKTAEEKKIAQRDRSVDVYNETVRQRVARNGGVELSLSKDVFSKIIENKNNTISNKIIEEEVEEPPKQSFVKKRRAPQPHHKCNIGVADINDDDLPSVRQLRNKFENDQRVSSDTKLNVVPLSSKKREALNKLSFKKGFNVMSSLTRRGASALSVSMHNLSSDSNDFSTNQKNIDFLNESANHKISSPKKRPNIIMQFEKNAESDREAKVVSRETKLESKSEEFIHEERPQQQMSSAQALTKAEVDDDDDDDDVIKTKTPGFLWNPAEVVAR